MNDAAAYIAELAREHGRNAAAAESMVRDAANFGAREAAAKNIVDVVSPTLPALLDEIDGTVTTPKGLTLHTAGATVDTVQMSFWQRTLDTLIDPNIIALMLSLGIVGLLVELWNPGLVLPGTVGAISLIVGLYGLQVLPVSAAGVLMLLLSLGLFVTDALVTSHGALTLAGAVTFVIGALMLFDPAGPAYQVSLWTALAIAGTLVAAPRRRALADRQGTPQSRRGRGRAARRRRGRGAPRRPRRRQRRALAGAARGRPAAAARRPRHGRGGRSRPRPGRRIREPHRRELALWTSH